MFFRRFIAPLWLPVLVLFAFDGFVFGTWAARVPDISAQVHASSAALGAALLCVSFGALATMQLAGRWCARYGAGAVATAAGLMLCFALVLPGFAGNVGELAAALVIFGAATGMVNVAANSLGVRLESGQGRSLMPMLHAGVSFGALFGAVLGGVASSMLSVLVHLIVVGVFGLVAVLASARALARVDPLPAASARVVVADRPVARVSHRSLVILLGAIAGSTAFAEGTLTDWAALHLRTDLAASPVAAASAFAGFSLAMGVGRLLGGRAVQYFGETRLLIGGALIAAVAMLVAALTTSVPLALVSFLVVGFGLANVFPIALASAGALAGPAGVALASTVGYSGLLGGPPLIGFVAEHLGLPFALTLVSLFAVAVAVVAFVVRALGAARSLPLFREATVPVDRRVVAAARFSQLFHGYAADLELLNPPVEARGREERVVSLV